MAPPVEAAGQTRSLKLYFIHTKEKAQITFKRNGRYDQKVCSRSSFPCATGGRNEPTKMDRACSISSGSLQKRRSRDYIHVVSAYRSPARTAC